jgi:hypothetical protein
MSKSDDSLSKGFHHPRRLVTGGVSNLACAVRRIVQGYDEVRIPLPWMSKCAIVSEEPRQGRCRNDSDEHYKMARRSKQRSRNTEFPLIVRLTAISSGRVVIRSGDVLAALMAPILILAPVAVPCRSVHRRVRHLLPSTGVVPMTTTEQSARSNCIEYNQRRCRFCTLLMK